jgi:hypothetical protein
VGSKLKSWNAATYFSIAHDGHITNTLCWFHAP